MPAYRSPEGDYPRYPGDINRANPEWTDSDPLPDGWAEVIPTAQPADIKETYEEDSKRYLSHVTCHVVDIELIDGVWTQVWAEGERIAVGYWDDDTGEWADQPRLIAEYVDGEWIEPTVSSEQ